MEREARNQLLGEAGEEFVIRYERARLIQAGKDSLADRIEQVSSTVGPSAGFDILSFEENGSDRYIEAKTTKYGKNTPFSSRRTSCGFPVTTPLVIFCTVSLSSEVARAYSRYMAIWENCAHLSRLSS